MDKPTIQTFLNLTVHVLVVIVVFRAAHFLKRRFSSYNGLVNKIICFTYIKIDTIHQSPYGKGVTAA